MFLAKNDLHLKLDEQINKNSFLKNEQMKGYPVSVQIQRMQILITIVLSLIGYSPTVNHLNNINGIMIHSECDLYFNFLYDY